MIKKILILLFLGLMMVNIYCSESSGGDDDAAGTPANGVYAKLIVARCVSVVAMVTVKTDTIEALFSDTYDSCATTSDLQPASVTCNIYDLPWDGNLNLYKYQEPLNIAGFLIPGDTYTFNVAASAEVPALTASIDFPLTGPIITSPANNETVSSSGFTLDWSDAEGSGTVEIIILNNSTQESLYVEAADNGSYTFSASELSALSTGSCFLKLEKYNEDNITAAGYDNRSIIRARHNCNLMITLN